MKNKLGINDQNKLKKIEYYLFNIKYHIIDDNYSFNEETLFDIKYLEKIHVFLFNDLYNLEFCKIRSDIKEDTIDEINEKLNEIRKNIYNSNIGALGDLIYYIWKNQIFYDGNTRTLLCYLKILSKCFNFEIEYDFNKDVKEDYFINKILEKIHKFLVL